MKTAGSLYWPELKKQQQADFGIAFVLLFVNLNLSTNLLKTIPS